MLELLTLLANKVKKLATKVDLFFNDNTLTTSGLETASASNRFKITSGGYRKIGKICQVQLYLTAQTTLAANDYWTVLTGLPTPVNDYVALSAVRYTGLAPVSAYIGGSSLGIVLGNQNITSEAVIFITGMYVTK